MGILSALSGMNAMNKILNGGEAYLSVSQLVDMNLNMMEARKNLPSYKFQKVEALFYEKKRQTEKIKMDMTKYLIVWGRVKAEFTQIAPFEYMTSPNPPSYV